MRIIILTCLLAVLQLSTPFSCPGQQLGSYNLQFLPQRGYMNPSFVPHSKVHVGIPAFSGISYNYSNNGFRYSDLLRKDDKQSLYLDIQNMVNELKTRNHISLHGEVEILALGVKVTKNYFTLNVTEKLDFNFDFSRSMMEFIYEGNAATAGTTQQLNPGIEGIHYREYGLTWAREINKFLSAGIRVKYLYGMENVLTKGNGFTIYTDPTDFTITASSDYTAYTSGLDTNAFNSFDFGNYAFGKNNSGYGIDVGINVRATKTIELSAAVIDFGKIKWTTDNSVYHSWTSESGFMYSGINLDEFINNDTLDATTYLQTIGDSLYESFNISTTHSGYTYKMPLQLYFSASYYFTPRYKITALVRNKTLYHSNLTDFQLSFTGKSKTWLNYTLGLNKMNKTRTTLGGGFTINFHNDQVYFVSDNIPGLFNWKQSYTTGFRAGINIMFGTRLKYMKPPQPLLESPVSTL